MMGIYFPSFFVLGLVSFIDSLYLNCGMGRMMYLLTLMNTQ